MLVVIDTNIYVGAGFRILGGPFEILAAFISKTKSKVYVPKVVEMELRSEYSKELTSRVIATRRAVGSLDALINKGINIDLKIDNETQTDEYIGGLYEILQINDECIRDHHNEWMDDLIRRAVKRLRPSREGKEEFRDCLIWLTVLELAKENPDEEVSLISKDGAFAADKVKTHKDKGEKDKNVLHPDLQKESVANSCRIQLFDSLDTFLRSHADPLTFLDMKWLENISTEYDLETKIYTKITDTDYELFFEFFRVFDPHCTFIYLQACLESKIQENYYAVTMSDGSVRVQVDVDMKLEVGYKVAGSNIRNLSISGVTGSTFATVAGVSEESDSRRKIVIVRSRLQINVVKEEVVSVDILSWALSDDHSSSSPWDSSLITM